MMQKFFLSVFAVLSLLACNSHASVLFAGADVDYFTQADGLSTDLSGSDQQLTLTAWVNLDVSESNGIISKENVTNNNRQYGMIENSSDVLTCPVSSAGTASVTGTGTTVLDVGTWYHLGCVYNDVDIRPYVDGVLDGTPTAHTAGIFNGSAPFRIGERSGVANPFDGEIEDVCVCNTALTAEQMLQIATSKIKGMCREVCGSSLVLYCSLQQCPVGSDCTQDMNCSPGSVMTDVGTPVGSGDTNLNLRPTMVVGQ